MGLLTTEEGLQISYYKLLLKAISFFYLHSQVPGPPPYVFQRQEQGSSCQLRQEQNKDAFIHSLT